ncbi:MAG: serine/threonine protein kinase, partial [Elusimicrobia bacterium]
MIDAGSKIGNYKVTRLLGEGGMGRVFEGIHEQIGRRAAIKVLHAQFAHNSEAYTRFLNEARAVNIIQHPGLVNVFEFGQTEDGSPYIVMEFLEGETLADR